MRSWTLMMNNKRVIINISMLLKLRMYLDMEVLLRIEITIELNHFRKHLIWQSSKKIRKSRRKIIKTCQPPRKFLIENYSNGVQKRRKAKLLNSQEYQWRKKMLIFSKKMIYIKWESKNFNRRHKNVS